MTNILTGNQGYVLLKSYAERKSPINSHCWVLLQKSCLLESTHLIHLTPPCKFLVFLTMPEGSGNRIYKQN